MPITHPPCVCMRPLLVSTWCALHIRSMSCLCKNLATTSAPNVKETPRSFSPQPSTSLSGSAHSRSHNKPWSGTSVGRITLRICSMDWRSGERPGEASHTRFSLANLMQTRFKVIQSQPTSMTAEDFLIDNSSHRQTVEAICEGLPQLYVIPSFTWTKTEDETSAKHLQ